MDSRIEERCATLKLTILYPTSPVVAGWLPVYSGTMVAMLMRAITRKKTPVAREKRTAYEMATIIEDGIDQMYGQDKNVFYYLTLYNEPFVQPAKPEGSTEGILAGLYKWDDGPESDGDRATIIFSGAAQKAVREAQVELAERFDIGAELWSATSYKRLREDALAVDRWNRLNPVDSPRTAFVTSSLQTSRGPIVAVTDYMRSVPDQIAPYAPRHFSSLGTDGYGRSDTREALRSFFEVDADHIVVAVLSALAREGTIDSRVARDAIERYNIDPNSAPPWLR